MDVLGRARRARISAALLVAVVACDQPRDQSLAEPSLSIAPYIQECGWISNPCYDIPGGFHCVNRKRENDSPGFECKRCSLALGGCFPESNNPPVVYGTGAVGSNPTRPKGWNHSNLNLIYPGTPDYWDYYDDLSFISHLFQCPGPAVLWQDYLTSNRIYLFDDDYRDGEYDDQEDVIYINYSPGMMFDGNGIVIDQQRFFEAAVEEAVHAWWQEFAQDGTQDKFDAVRACGGSF